MKRKGRKSKTAEKPSNGVTDRQDQNGDAASEADEQELKAPEDKRRTSNKRKSTIKKGEENVEDNAHEGSNEPEEGRRRSNKRKSLVRKENENNVEDKAENKELEEPDEKRKKSGKNKKAAKKSEEDEESAQYEVEQVLDEKMIQGVRHYLIRWKGYEPESDTWEPESTLNCSDLITEFKAKMKKKNKLKIEHKRGRKKTKTLSEEQTWNENQDYEVDRILDVYFKKNGQREFLVSWKGYPTSQNSWEPEENMDCKELIKKFMEKVEKAKISDYRELRIKRTHTDRLTLMSDRRGRRLSKRNLQKQRVHYYDAE